MGERTHTEDEWREILAPVERRLATRVDEDLSLLSADELAARLKQDSQYITLLELHKSDLLGDWADALVEEWLESKPDFPFWFVDKRLQGVQSSGVSQ